jgi:predicted RNA binding protein YcfA (HicA-like mRNA interferase family)
VTVPKDFYRDLVKILLAAGFTQIDGGKGSHEKWQNANTRKCITVPRSKSRHTANEVLKQAGLRKAF